MTTERDELLQDIRGTFIARGLDISALIAERLWSRGYRKPRTITTAEELDALPVGALILTPNTNPDYPSVFRSLGRGQWMELDPGDRSDGEDTTTAAGLLRWDSKDGTAVVLWEAPDA